MGNKNLRLFFIFLTLFAGTIYSQVEIKEEIILNNEQASFEEIDAEILTMPFYGSARGGVSWGDIWWGYLKAVEIKAGGVTIFKGFPNCAAGYLNGEWAINNLPMGTAVTITVYGSCPGGVLTEAETNLVQTGNDEYRVEYLHYSEWRLATTVRFVEQTPPGCANATACSGPPEPPNINLVINQNGFDGQTVCDESDNAAGFKPAANQFFGLYNVGVCFNSQTQRWQYELDNQHTLSLNVIIDYCEQNINNHGGLLINDFHNFPSGYGCDNILRNIKNHFKYPPELGSQTGIYLLKTILYEHELKHKEYFENILDQEKVKFQTDLYSQIPTCQDINDIGQAQIYWRKKFDAALISFWKNATDRNDKETGLYDKDKKSNPSVLKFNLHELRTNQKIFKFIIQKIISARTYYNCF